MALHVSELDQFAVEELEKAFPDEASLPQEYDSILWTGFKEDQGTCDITGQILARPKGWEKHEAAGGRWKFAVVCMFCHDLGGTYLRGMRFPRHSHAETDGRLPFSCDPKDIEKMVRTATQNSIKRLLWVIGEN